MSIVVHAPYKHPSPPAFRQLFPPLHRELRVLHYVKAKGLATATQPRGLAGWFHMVFVFILSSTLAYLHPYAANATCHIQLYIYQKEMAEKPGRPQDPVRRRDHAQ